MNKQTAKMSTLALSTKKTRHRSKKDLSPIAMTKANVYVSSIAISNNPDYKQQTFVEIESFKSTSIILIYLLGEFHALDMKNLNQQPKYIKA